jgi:hypothetical protein
MAACCMRARISHATFLSDPQLSQGVLVLKGVNRMKASHNLIGNTLTITQNGQLGIGEPEHAPWGTSSLPAWDPLPTGRNDFDSVQPFTKRLSPNSHRNAALG